MRHSSPYLKLAHEAELIVLVIQQAHETGQYFQLAHEAELTVS
jgi:hypothetical protein